MSPDLKVAIVRRRAPTDLRTCLQLHAADYQEDYDRFHGIIEAYFSARGQTSIEPIRVDALAVGSARFVPLRGGRGQGKGA